MMYNRLSYYNFEHTPRYHRKVDRATITVIYLLIGGLLVDTVGSWWAMAIPALLAGAATLAFWISFAASWMIFRLIDWFIDWLQGW